jgi:hypothetical protein
MDESDDYADCGANVPHGATVVAAVNDTADGALLTHSGSIYHIPGTYLREQFWLMFPEIGRLRADEKKESFVAIDSEGQFRIATNQEQTTYVWSWKPSVAQRYAEALDTITSETLENLQFADLITRGMSLGPVEIVDPHETFQTPSKYLRSLPPNK